MAIEPGTGLGPYEILGSLGAGGMGEVYRAKDTKLGREVAIKTLPSALAQDPERLARFEREAKLLATLNHAHIGAIYGLDEHDGTLYIAMELIEGQTLEEKLKAGALPIEDALRIALQIAEALEAAHDKGVVHRDLKPANVMLTPDGVVKVLDFGLAKAFSGDPNAASPAHSPALSAAMTQQGLILGTAGYMSPEQASGQATDQRADIWAFGVVLYEMLTGLPLFSGESVPHILADVLRTEPDWKRLPRNLHPRLRLLLERCLRKKVRDRYHSMADVRVDIEEILKDPQAASAALAAAPAARALWRRALPIAAAAIVTGVVVGSAVWFSTRPAPQPLNRFEIAPPEPLYGFSGQSGRSLVTISPDGRNIVFITEGGPYLRTLGELEARAIQGGERETVAPSFSPDSRSVAYFAPPDQIKRIAINGGAPVRIASGVANPSGGLSWAADGTLLIGAEGGILRVPANGGTAEVAVEAPEERRYTPRLLPDGDSLLYGAPTADGGMQVLVQSLSTGEQTVVLENGYAARYLPTGHLVYSLGTDLFAIAFDLNGLRVFGNAVPVVQGVLGGGSLFAGISNYDISDDGTLVYVTDDSLVDQRTLVWVDRTGRETSLGAPSRSYVYPRMSPDGTKVALDVRDEQNDIWIWDLARPGLARLTFGDSLENCPVWSPDSRRVAFSSRAGPGAPATLFWRQADGTGSAEPLAPSNATIFCATSFLPDGSGLLAFTGLGGAAGNDDIGLVRIGENRLTPLLQTAFDEGNPSVSPDGQWIAYSSNESGRNEIYVRPIPDVDAGRWQVSTGGGEQPLWAHNGRELFYRSGAALMHAAIDTDRGFAVSNPEVLFEDDYSPGLGGRAYDVSPDDERFLMIKESTAPSERIVVVQNWFDELERLAPTR
jgi:Tol biopolymer transport system component